MRVPTYEEAFDIIHQAHTDELGHAKDRVKNKVAINKNGTVYQFPPFWCIYNCVLAAQLESDNSMWQNKCL